MIKNFLEEFKTFAMRGNVIDLAVGVVIGTAFGKIVSSLVENVIMPFIGGISGGLDLTGLKYSYVSDLTNKGVDVMYGKFLQSILDFVIIAFSIFIAMKVINALKRKEEEKAAISGPPELPAEVKILTEIRDLLKK